MDERNNKVAKYNQMATMRGEHLSIYNLEKGTLLCELSEDALIELGTDIDNKIAIATGKEPTILQRKRILFLIDRMIEKGFTLNRVRHALENFLDTKKFYGNDRDWQLSDFLSYNWEIIPYKEKRKGHRSKG